MVGVVVAHTRDLCLCVSEDSFIRKACLTRRSLLTTQQPQRPPRARPACLRAPCTTRQACMPKTSTNKRKSVYRNILPRSSKNNRRRSDPIVDASEVITLTAGRMNESQLSSLHSRYPTCLVSVDVVKANDEHTHPHPEVTGTLKSRSAMYMSTKIVVSCTS